MSIIGYGFAPNGVRIIVKDDYMAKTPEEDARVFEEQMRIQRELMCKIAMTNAAKGNIGALSAACPKALACSPSSESSAKRGRDGSKPPEGRRRGRFIQILTSMKGGRRARRPRKQKATS